MIMLTRELRQSGVTRRYRAAVGRAVFVLQPLESRTLLSATAITTVQNVEAGSNDYLLPDGSGNLYGYTQFGGANGQGSIYEIVGGTGTPVVLTSLPGTGVGLGFGDIEGIAVDAAGNVFGINDDGPRVFELPKGASTPIAVASNTTDLNSGLPIGTLTGIALDSATDTLYFTDISGGVNSGTSGSIDKLIVGGNSIQVAASFSGGAIPSSHMIFDSNGNMFGVTALNAFEMVKGSGLITTLGTVPANHQLNGYAPLAVDDSGDLFGVEPTGGAAEVGAVYALDAGSPSFTILGNFSADGHYPSGVVLDGGLLIGVTTSGGANQDGTLYEIPVTGVSNVPAGITKLTDFDSTDAQPFGNIVLVNGTVYGLTVDNAPNSPNQVVFQATLDKTSSGGGGGSSSSLSATISKSTLPASVIAGGTSKGQVFVTVANGTDVAATANAVDVYASTDGTVDGSAILLGTEPKPFTLKGDKSGSVAVQIKSLPSDLSGHYTLLAQLTDSVGNTATSGPGPELAAAPAFVSLSETLTSKLAASLISNSTVKGSVTLTITNNGNVLAKGLTSINVTVSTTSGTVGTSIAPFSQNLSFSPRKPIKVTVPIKSLPALATGNYFIVAQVTDPFGHATSIVSSAATTVIAAPFIALAATLGPVSKIQAGDTLTLVDNGNIEDVSALHVTFGFSTDSAGADPVGQTVSLVTKTMHFAVGKRNTIHFSNWSALLSSLTPGGTYFLTLDVADAAANRALAVSSTSFTV
jgi:uncharacterized repeat protein (TIGR03803 family)